MMDDPIDPTETPTVDGDATGSSDGGAVTAVEPTPLREQVATDEPVRLEPAELPTRTLEPARPGAVRRGLGRAWAWTRQATWGERLAAGFGIGVLLIIVFYGYVLLMVIGGTADVAAVPSIDGYAVTTPGVATAVGATERTGFIVAAAQPGSGSGSTAGVGADLAVVAVDGEGFAEPGVGMAGPADPQSLVADPVGVGAAVEGVESPDPAAPGGSSLAPPAVPADRWRIRVQRTSSGVAQPSRELQLVRGGCYSYPEGSVVPESPFPIVQLPASPAGVDADATVWFTSTSSAIAAFDHALLGVGPNGRVSGCLPMPTTDLGDQPLHDAVIARFAAACGPGVPRPAAADGPVRAIDPEAYSGACRSQAAELDDREFFTPMCGFEPAQCTTVIDPGPAATETAAPPPGVGGPADGADAGAGSMPAAPADPELASPASEAVVPAGQPVAPAP